MAENHEFEVKEAPAIAPEKPAEQPPEECPTDLEMIMNLTSEQALLNAQAAQMDEDAKRLEADGDDEAKQHAAQMHQQAGVTQSVAKELGQAAQELQFGGHKKNIRAKRDTLLLRASVVLGVGEQEIESYTSAGGDNTEEHKHQMKVAQHEGEKHAKPKSAVAEKIKKLFTPKMRGSSTHTPPLVVEEEPMTVRMKRSVTHYWDAATEEATHAYDYVRTSAVGVFAVKAAHKMGDLCEETYDAVTHPVTTLKNAAHGIANVTSNLAHRAGAVLSRMGTAVMAFLPFGGDEDEQPAPQHYPILVAHHKPLNAQAMHAAKQVGLPPGIAAPVHKNAGESFVPYPVMSGLPLAAGWAIS